MQHVKKINEDQIYFWLFWVIFYLKIRSGKNYRLTNPPPVEYVAHIVVSLETVQSVYWMLWFRILHRWTNKRNHWLNGKEQKALMCFHPSSEIIYQRIYITSLYNVCKSLKILIQRSGVGEQHIQSIQHPTGKSDCLSYTHSGMF